MDLVLSGRSIPYTVNALEAVSVGHSLVPLYEFYDSFQTMRQR
jgi:hypothetical protein